MDAIFKHEVVSKGMMSHECLEECIFIFSKKLELTSIHIPKLIGVCKELLNVFGTLARSTLQLEPIQSYSI